VKAVASASAASERRRGRSGGRGDTARGRSGARGARATGEAGQAGEAGEAAAAEEPVPDRATTAAPSLAADPATSGAAADSLDASGARPLNDAAPAPTGTGRAARGGVPPTGRWRENGPLTEVTDDATAPAGTDRADGAARLDEADRELSATGEEPIMGKVLRRFRL